MKLEDFIEKKNAHCFTCIKEPSEKLSQDICNKIKSTITNKLERSLSNEEFKVFQSFTGTKSLSIIHGTHLHVGNEDRGMLHILLRHFRENGDKHGGRIEYIDIILIPTILRTISYIIKSNGHREYKYTREDGKIFLLITNKFNNKWYVKSFYSSDTVK